MVFWYLGAKRWKGELGMLALPLISLLVIVAAAHRTVDTVSPFMRTPWFYLHTFFFFLSYGFFAVSFCAGALYMCRASVDCESMQYRTAAYGWVLYSVSLVMGSIWFFTAYGTYWLWTSRELWMTITWFFFGLYLHARLIVGIRGRVASALGILGFAVAMFAYFGVGTVLPSPPTQF
jgi:ABC-type transport system involved in cytochrome c biogenesis permease subunit